jgi:hypothetical protein
MLVVFAAVGISRPPMYTEFNNAHDLHQLQICAVRPNEPCVLAQTESAVERERREYRERQDRLRCANHPEECFRKETEVEREQREYRKRQHRLRCANHPKDPNCR